MSHPGHVVALSRCLWKTTSAISQCNAKYFIFTVYYSWICATWLKYGKHKPKGLSTGVIDYQDEHLRFGCSEATCNIKRAKSPYGELCFHDASWPRTMDKIIEMSMEYKTSEGSFVSACLDTTELQAVPGGSVKGLSTSVNATYCRNVIKKNWIGTFGIDVTPTATITEVYFLTGVVQAFRISALFPTKLTIQEFSKSVKYGALKIQWSSADRTHFFLHQLIVTFRMVLLLIWVIWCFCRVWAQHWPHASLQVHETPVFGRANHRYFRNSNDGEIEREFRL